MNGFLESEYRKHNNIYFDTRSAYGREPDTIIIFTLKTSTGRLSKYYATLRFNSERNISGVYKSKKINEYAVQLMTDTFKKEIKKGYILCEPILYSGKV